METGRKNDFTFDNTARVKSEGEYLQSIGYLDKLADQAQKECNIRNREYKQVSSKYPAGSKWVYHHPKRHIDGYFTILEYSMFFGQFLIKYPGLLHCRQFFTS